MADATNGRNVVVGLAVRAGRIGATTSRLALFPVRAAARSPLAGPFHRRAEGLAETGRSAEVEARRRLETAAGDVLATREAEQVLDDVLAGPLPEAVARSLVAHRVVERVVAEALEREAVSERETQRTERFVEQMLESPALKRLLADALESRLTVDLTDRVLRSPAFRRALGDVLSSPELRAALKGQSRSLAEEIVDDVRRRLFRADDAVERRPRHWFRRPPRSPVAVEGAPPVAYGGIATRGLALVVDAALATGIFLTGTAVLGLVVSLVWKPHPAVEVGAFMAVAALLVEVTYFVGFWTTAGQTPGLRLMHLRVVDRDGSPPGLARSLLRLIGLALAIALLCTGFLPALVDNRRRALQDFLAGTVVVSDGDASHSARESLAAATYRDDSAPAERLPATGISSAGARR